MSTEQRTVFEGIAAQTFLVGRGQTVSPIIRLSVDEQIDCYVKVSVACEANNSRGTIIYANPLDGKMKTEEVTRAKKFSLAVRSDDGRQTGTIEWRQVR